MTQITSSKLSSPALAALGSVTEVLVPGDDGYAGAAVTVFGDGTPDLVVRPRDAAGVAAALRYAAGAGLAVTVRSGGHSMAGLSTSADGMVIDTRRVSGMRLLDPAARRVRIGAGATWGEVAAALIPHGLGLTAGDTSQVGVAGLTLGGGIGWLVRQHGLTIDSLVGAQVVTADGRLVGADAVEHADLFWALRGGGGNFGVVVDFDFVAQPVTNLHFGSVAYRPDDPASDANRAAWATLAASPTPALIAFSDSDPITGAMAPILKRVLPGAQGRKHPTIANAGHFLQEDAGAELAAAILAFVEQTPLD